MITSLTIGGGTSLEHHEKSLQQAFVFGETDEVRLFRDELGEWKGLWVTDGIISFVESQILWGDSISGKTQDGFTRVQDNTKGIPDQLIPLEIDELKAEECIRLVLHHTVVYDNGTGEARIALSRLAGLRVGKREEVVK